MKYKLLLLLTCSFALNGCFLMQNDTDTRSGTNPYELLNTTWTYTDEDQKYDITFKKGGKLSTTHPNDVTKDNDTWRQSGEIVFFDFNDKYAVYKGKFVTVNKIEGTGKNDSDSWPFQLVRKRK